jgi:hypothetical protein
MSPKRTTTFSLDFIQRTLRTTGILLLILFVVVLYYFGFYDALALLTAGIWSMVNLIFLTALVRTALRPDNVNKMAAAGLALIKFPLLYAAGYFLVTVDVFRALPLVVGFSMVLAVMVLKAVTRALLHLDDNNTINQESSSRGLA